MFFTPVVSFKCLRVLEEESWADGLGSVAPEIKDGELGVLFWKLRTCASPNCGFSREGLGLAGIC